MKKSKPNKLVHPCFPQPIDGSVKVWRYMDLAKLVSLIQHKSLYFTRLDHLDDAFEGATPEFLVKAFQDSIYQLTLHTKLEQLIETYGQIEGQKRYTEEYSEIVLLAESNVKGLFMSKKSLYVNCWHMGNYESEAMWKLYSPMNTGIAIQTTYDKLVSSVSHSDETFIGTVTYIDYETQAFSPANALYPVMHKRMSFSHENEVRLVQWHPSPQDRRPEFLTCKWDYNKTIENIFVNPYAPSFYFESVVYLLNKIAPKLSNQIKWSNMRVKPWTE